MSRFHSFRLVFQVDQNQMFVGGTAERRWSSEWLKADGDEKWNFIAGIQ